MAGWKGLGNFDNTAVPETIKQDAKTFFQTLSGIERDWSENHSDVAVTYCEDGTGQHAVVLECPHDGESWHYALIYDRDNRRIKVLKYSTNMSGITNVSKCSDIRLAGIPRRSLTTRSSERLMAATSFLQSTSCVAMSRR